MASVESAFLGNASFVFNVMLPMVSVTLAPQSVVAAMGIDPVYYCPLQSLMQGMSVPLPQTAPALHILRISGFDLPLPTDSLSAGCAVPDCTAMGGCGQLGVRLVHLSTEPAMLQRDVMRWVRDIGLNGPGTTITFPSPPLDLWSPALNRSDWLPTDLLCDIDVARYTLPTLPYADDSTGLRMPFSLPAGLLRCLSNSTQLNTIDWQAARFFSSNMLIELPANHTITLKINTEALYGGVRPVPVGFFDPLSPSITVSGICGQSCARIASQCPYFVDGACQLCPLGSFKRVRAVLDQLNVPGPHAYCSACPLGSYCDSTISPDPIPCPAGSYANSTGLGRCTPCPAGSINVHTGSNSSAACQPCALGQSSSAGSTQCVDCEAGTFAATEGQGECTPCDAGSANPLSAATSAAACQPCVPGHFAALTGLTVCSECAAGKYSATKGQSACDLCPTGQHHSTVAVGVAAAEPAVLGSTGVAMRARLQSEFDC